jgi:hypothetical protein
VSVRTLGLVLKIEPQGEYEGDYVYLNDELIGFRPYDGGEFDVVEEEVLGALGEMLCERLGWKRHEHG